jgi:hypothetical protein
MLGKVVMHRILFQVKGITPWYETYCTLSIKTWFKGSKRKRECRYYFLIHYIAIGD